MLFSDSDPIFSPTVAERIAEHIPAALEPEIVAGAGHFLQENQGEAIGRRIARFVTGSSPARGKHRGGDVVNS